MTHSITSNEAILNTKLLEIIKIYIWYIAYPRHMCLKTKTSFGQTWWNDKLNYL